MEIKGWGFEMDVGCEDLYPTKGHEDDTGWDIRASRDFLLCKFDVAVVSTGLHVHLPSGYASSVRPRSGLTKQGIMVQLGTIDHGYTGEVKVIIYSIVDHEIKRGDRIAQLVIEPLIRLPMGKWQGKRDSSRGSDGFGSTGVK